MITRHAPRWFRRLRRLLAGLGSSLTTQISGHAPVTTTRNAGESDVDFINRHCRAVLVAVHANGGDKLYCVEIAVELGRAEGQSDADFVAVYCAALLAAA